MHVSTHTWMRTHTHTEPAPDTDHECWLFHCLARNKDSVCGSLGYLWISCTQAISAATSQGTSPGLPCLHLFCLSSSLQVLLLKSILLTLNLENPEHIPSVLPYNTHPFPTSYDWYLTLTITRQDDPGRLMRNVQKLLSHFSTFPVTRVLQFFLMLSPLSLPPISHYSSPLSLPAPSIRSVNSAFSEFTSVA